jgi:hypothetical protein
MTAQILAIDPGLTGALALINKHDAAIYDMPTIEITVAGNKRNRLDVHRFMRMIVDFGHLDMVVLEELGVRPGQSAQSVSQTARGYGQIEGALTVLQRPVTYVRPQVWTKALGVGPDKGIHIERARALYPGLADKLLKSKDGRADALLIGHWYAWSGRQ